MAIWVQQIATGRWKQNCYIVHRDSGYAFCVDPGDEADRIIEYIEGKQLTLLAILNTHAHYDHIGAVAALKEKYSIPYYLHSKELKTLKHANVYRTIFDGYGPITIPRVDYYLDQLETTIHLPEFLIQILFTPGHSQGGVCFLVEDHLFTGDTLFKEKIGRTDLPGGDSSDLSSSLKNLSLLPPQMKIYPGHGETSTILEETQKNSALLAAINAH